jgi:DNA replication factor GINS
LYNDLYRAWKTEVTSQEAQPLPKDFYQKVDAYLRGLEVESSSTDEHSAKGRISLKEKEVVSRLLHELKETRLRKLLSSARDGQTINDAQLTEEEIKLLAGINQSLQVFGGPKVEKKETPPPEAAVELSVVRFLQDIPEIVGTDLRMYGPYKKEDVGSLPDQNAKALVKQGAAKEIEVRNVSKKKNPTESNINNK